MTSAGDIAGVWINDQKRQQYLGIGLDALDPQDNNIEQDKFDRRAFKELSESSEEMKAILKPPGREDMKAWPPLVRDIWSTFYKYNPELAPEEKVDTPYQAMRPFVERTLEDKETEQIRVNTVMDELSSALATISAGKKLAEEIVNRPDLQQAMQKAEQAVQAHEQGNDIACGALTEEAQSGLQQAARDVRRAIREAVTAGQGEVEKLQEALAGWGLESGDLQRVPMGQRLELARRLTGHRLKRLADLVGRLRNLARARQKDKLDKMRDEIHSITMGADLGRVLPAEVAAIRHPVRRLDFYRKYNEKQLLQYDLKSREKVGRGPIVALTDTSGSMGGEPMDWAVAVTMALADTAARQKRRCMVAFFDTRVHTVVEILPGERDPNKIIQMATVGASGGTSFEPALKKAMETIQSINYQKADIVMTTDGLCRIDEGFMKKFLAEKERLNFRTWTVLIGYQPDDQMKKWSDEIWPVRKLTEETAGEIFERVV